MPYIRRGLDGQIESLHRQGDAAMDFLPEGHAELMAFVGSTERGASPDAAPAEGHGFNQLDADFVRVIEDVIDTLITRNIINITDLPGEAQAKLFARKSFRERSSRNSLSLFGEPGYASPAYDNALVDDTNLGDLS